MTAKLIVATLALCTLTLVAAPGAAAHHGGWDCHGQPGVVEVCTARTLQTGDDCFLKTDILGDVQPHCYHDL